MQATVRRKELQDAFSKVARCANTQSSMPILGGIKIGVGETSHLELYATDLEVSAHAFVDGSCKRDKGPDEVVVNVAVLSEIIETMGQKAKIHLSTKTTKVMRQGKKEKASILHIENAELETLSLEDYPENQKPLGRCVCQIDGGVFKKALNRLARMALKAGETTRLSLTAIHLEWLYPDHEITLVSTNGYRLEKDVLPAKLHSKAPKKGETLIRADNLKAVAKNIGPEDRVWLYRGYMAEAKKGFPTFGVRVGSSDTSYVNYTLKVEGEDFPDFEQVIPIEKGTYSFMADAKELIAKIKSARIMASSETDGITFAFRSNSPELEVAAESEKGKYVDTLPISKFKHSRLPGGMPFRIAIKAQYLLDYLGLSEAKTVRVEFWSSERASLWRSVEDAGQLYVCMPIRLNA